MKPKTKFWLVQMFSNITTFFLEGWIAVMLWNGVGHTLFGLPHSTYWQMLGLTIMVTVILPTNRTIANLIEKLVFDEKGNEK